MASRLGAKPSSKKTAQQAPQPAAAIPPPPALAPPASASKTTEVAETKPNPRCVERLLELDTSLVWLKTDGEIQCIIPKEGTMEFMQVHKSGGIPIEMFLRGKPTALENYKNAIVEARKKPEMAALVGMLSGSKTLQVPSPHEIIMATPVARAIFGHLVAIHNAKTSADGSVAESTKELAKALSDFLDVKAMKQFRKDNSVDLAAMAQKYDGQYKEARRIETTMKKLKGFDLNNLDGFRTAYDAALVASGDDANLRQLTTKALEQQFKEFKETYNASPENRAKYNDWSAFFVEFRLWTTEESAKYSKDYRLCKAIIAAIKEGKSSEQMPTGCPSTPEKIKELICQFPVTREAFQQGRAWASVLSSAPTRTLPKILPPGAIALAKAFSDFCGDQAKLNETKWTKLSILAKERVGLIAARFLRGPSALDVEPVESSSDVFEPALDWLKERVNSFYNSKTMDGIQLLENTVSVADMLDNVLATVLNYIEPANETKLQLRARQYAIDIDDSNVTETLRLHIHAIYRNINAAVLSHPVAILYFMHLNPTDTWGAMVSRVFDALKNSPYLSGLEANHCEGIAQDLWYILSTDRIIRDEDNDDLLDKFKNAMFGITGKVKYGFLCTVDKNRPDETIIITIDDDVPAAPAAARLRLRPRLRLRLRLLLRLRLRLLLRLRLRIRLLLRLRLRIRLLLRLRLRLRLRLGLRLRLRLGLLLLELAGLL